MRTNKIDIGWHLIKEIKIVIASEAYSRVFVTQTESSTGEKAV